jgi:ring-1,2-phenylacetyl-CoA epoxidase subunit PaaD
MLALAEQVPDPELPMLTIQDLGILRALRLRDDCVEVDITPTYSGCPATQAIADDIEQALRNAGAARVHVSIVLAPAWSSDWISAAGRAKLRLHGIAPPGAAAPLAQTMHYLPRTTLRPEASETVACPRCGSADTACLSHFSSTACKALYRCLACREAFEYFKPY